MKQITYLLSLMNVTLPNRKPVHRDSFGNPTNVVSMTDKPTTTTVYPNDNINQWNPSNADAKVWEQQMNVGRLYSRFVIGAGKDNVIINRVKFMPEKVERFYTT